MGKGPRTQIRFGVYEVDLSAHELRKSGTRIKIQEQPFRVLTMLLESPGTVVTRETLKRQLWSDDTFVEFDKNLSTAVRKIRQALGDSSTTPRYVETVPRVGYRFIAPVEGSPEPERSHPPVHRASSWPVPLVVGGLLLVSLGAATFHLRQRQPAHLPSPEAIPLTTYPGQEIDPAFSPDGNQIAFAWDGGDGGDFDLYLKTIGPGDPAPLTEDPRDDIHPAWSPDGRFIAFTRVNPPGGLDDVVVVPALGGRERVITQAGSRVPSAWTAGRGVAWTADSQWLIVTEPTLVNGQSARLFLVSVRTGEQRRLTSPPAGRGAPTSDVHPAVSPDGRWVAFERRASTASEIFKIALSGDPGPAGQAIQVLPTSTATRKRPTWSAGGDAIVFAEGEAGEGLWRAAAAGGSPPQKLPIVGINAAISPSASRIVYQAERRDLDIWALELAAPGLAGGEPQRVIASTRADLGADYSPDGSQIAFTSYRTDSGEIWIADSDGSHPLRLTDFAGPRTGTPRWSPDGRFILFNSTVAGNKEVFLIPAAGGTPRRLTDHPSDDAMPSWASDSRSFYTRSNRSGRDEIWRIPLNGGEAVRITRGGARAGFESKDGEWLYYIKENQLWRAPAKGGEGEPIGRDIHSHKWRLAKNGVYYTPAARKAGRGDNQIRYLDFATGQSRLVLESEAAIAVDSISPDGRFLLYRRWERVESDLMLIEGFE